MSQVSVPGISWALFAGAAYGRCLKNGLFLPVEFATTVIYPPNMPLRCP